MGKDSQILPFHALLITTLTAGTFNFNLNPSSLASFATRVGAVADSWCQYRIRRLRFRLRIPPAGFTGSQAVGYVGGVQDTPPSTRGTIMELLPSTSLDFAQSIPSDWVNVSRADLAGALPWYKAIAGAADPTEESPGLICLAGTGTDAAQLEIEGVYEFKAAAATANTPAAMQMMKALRLERVRLERERERIALISVLATPVPSSFPPKVEAGGLAPQ
jgi:hypothetical protein